jgi:hypothetical protein
LENPSGFNIDHQLTNGALVDLIDSRCQQLIEKMAEVKFDRDL